MKLTQLQISVVNPLKGMLAVDPLKGHFGCSNNVDTIWHLIPRTDALRSL
jgi:hypothetical protein